MARYFNLPNQLFGQSFDDGQTVMYENAPGVYPLSTDWVPAPPEIFHKFYLRDFIRLNSGVWMAWSARTLKSKAWRVAFLKQDQMGNWGFIGFVHPANGRKRGYWRAICWSYTPALIPDFEVNALWDTEDKAINFLVKFVQEYVK